MAPIQLVPCAAATKTPLSSPPDPGTRRRERCLPSREESGAGPIATVSACRDTYSQWGEPQSLLHSLHHNPLHVSRTPAFSKHPRGGVLGSRARRTPEPKRAMLEG